jgi:putative flippase GtrA
LRFVIVGGICGAVQLALLGLFLRSGAPAIPANVAAFLLSAQVNFALSSFFTWHDRADTAATGGLGRQWLRFHGSIAGGALVNQAVFLLARHAAPDLTAAALGIGVAAVTNYLLQDRLVFRRNAPTPAAVRSTPDTGTA